MTLMYYILAAVALIATVRVITHTNAVYALLYFVISLLAVALQFYLIGAPFIAALEVIIYAGAIIVLFLFTIMMLNLGKEQELQEGSWMKVSAWIGPLILCAILLGITVVVIFQNPTISSFPQAVLPKDVGISLFGPYLIAVQLAALLLLSGLIGASHLGRQNRSFISANSETKGENS